jgi:hypothetical protein
MMKYTRSFTRPSIAVPWWFETQLGVPISVFDTQMANAYYATGKCIALNMSASADNLTLTFTGLWATAADHDEYMADTILQTYRSARVEYTTLHGITFMINTHI